MKLVNRFNKVIRWRNLRTNLAVRTTYEFILLSSGMSYCFVW